MGDLLEGGTCRCETEEGLWEERSYQIDAVSNSVEVRMVDCIDCLPWLACPSLDDIFRGMWNLLLLLVGEKRP